MSIAKALLAGTAVVGVVFYGTVIAPAGRDLQASRFENRAALDRISQLRQSASPLSSAEQKLEAEETALNAATEKWTALDKEVWTEEEIHTLLGRATVTEVSRTENFPYAKALYKIGLEGTYKEIAEYLNTLEKNSPFIHILSLKVTRKAGDDEWKERLECELDACFKLGSREAGADSKTVLTQPMDTLQSPFNFKKQIKTSVPRLTALVFRGKTPYIVIENKPFKEGSLVPGPYLVKEITRDHVTLAQNGVETVVAI